jgi:hypothetical protein
MTYSTAESVSQKRTPLVRDALGQSFVVCKEGGLKRVIAENVSAMPLSAAMVSWNDFRSTINSTIKTGGQSGQFR